jgi:hypothetical protein
VTGEESILELFMTLASLVEQNVTLRLTADRIE